jgi:hypothetical protein
MKLIKTFSRSEFVVEDDEAENIKTVLKSGQKTFIELRCGDVLNISAIESVGGIPKALFYRGESETYRVLKDGQTILNSYGNKITIDPSRCEYLEDTDRYEQKLLK